MTFQIHGIGTALPENSIRQEQAAEIAATFTGRPDVDRNALSFLYRATRVVKRHSVLLAKPSNGRPEQSFYSPSTGPDDRGPTTAARLREFAEHAPRLAVTASREALRNASLSPTRVTHIVTVTCTGFASPGIDYALIRELELSPQVGRVQVGFMGCHGALNAIRVAKAFTDADPRACVLLSAVELCSLHYQYGGDGERLVSNALFADGAAAMIGLGDGAAGGGRWRVGACGSCLLPESADAMTWQIGDHGFEMTLSTQVPQLIRTHLRGWLCEWLNAHGHAIERIASWAIHPGGPRVVREVTAALQVPPAAAAASGETLAAYGNMSSPTVLFVLKRLQETAAPRPSVALAFGPGLVVEATLFV